MARAQFAELGMGEGAIESRLKRGRLHRFHRGVYVVGYRRINRRGRWMAAVLASGSGACLSHRSAARFWQLMPPGDELVEVTLPPPGRARPRVSLPMLLGRYPGRRGTRNLWALLEAPEPVGFTRNDFEEAFLALVDAYGLPRPRMNADLALRERFFEIDAMWERERVAVELDSREVHGTRKRFESDRQRDRILVAEGWRTMHVTWRHLREEPAEIAADLKSLLA